MIVGSLKFIEFDETARYIVERTRTLLVISTLDIAENIQGFTKAESCVYKITRVVKDASKTEEGITPLY